MFSDNVWPKESRPSKSIALRPKNSVLNCDKIENEIKNLCQNGNTMQTII